MKNYNRLSTLILSCLLAGFFLAGSFLVVAPQARAEGYFEITGQPINQIKVIGTERIEPETVLTYMDTKVGDTMTQDTLDQALKSLYATGLFSDVTLRQKGNVLEVQVQENPIISQIAFEGNDKLKSEDLKNEIQLRERQVLTRSKVQADVARLYQLYQRSGRFAVSIDPKVIKLDQNRVNLVFEIDEGAVTKVRSVRFVGNRHYDDSKLRSVISTKEHAWYSFIAANDRYDPDRVSYDQELLRRFYLSQGYADFNIVSAIAELSADRSHFFLTVTVDEGERYKVKDVVVKSQIANMNPDDLKDSITIHKGDWYNADEVQTTIDHMTDKLGDLQYAFVQVKPDVQRDREGRTVTILLTINETPRVFVERIDIHGNVRTLDRVIRRKMQLVEGDPFNKSKVAKSEQKIKDLGYFEKATISPKPGSAPDRTVLDVDVTEQSTGELSLGAGFSTTDGPLANVGIRERNLLGKGQDLAIAATVAGKRTEYDLSFTEPYFLDRDFSAGFDLFHTTRDLQSESSFDQKRTGGALRFGYPLSEKWRQTFKYSLEQNDITNVDSDASLYIQQQEGTRLTSAVSQRTTYDGRDSMLDPTNGLLAWFDTEVAGLGGDAHYVSGKVGANYYYPIADKWVFNLLGETGAIAGYGGHDVEINERYFLGSSTLRGFKTAGIGPRDRATGDSLGGNLFYRGSAELTFPLGLPDSLGVRGHTFTDFGSLWNIDGSTAALGGVEDVNSLRASAGVGVSWKSPLGLIRVDLSKPYLSEDFDRDELFRFNFGTQF